VKVAQELTSVGATVKSAGDTNIYVQSWRPADDPVGVVVIVPGFNEHGGRYEWVADQLKRHGMVTYAVDLRGRGRSEGERFFVQDFDDYVSDVDAAVSLARGREPGLPVFLLGHSAGGVVACFYALQHGPDLAGLISESFSFELPAPDLALAALKGLSHVAPHAHVVALKNADFSRDEVVVQSMNDDPLIAHEVQPAQTIAEMARASDRLKSLFPNITVPVLILHGTEDKVAKPSGSQHFYEQVGTADRTLKIYEGHVHDLLHDKGKETVFADIGQWIDNHVVSGAGGIDRVH
jgi:acylglycerol lipase